MGSFLILLPGPEVSPQAERMFSSGLEFARTVPGQPPSRILETDEVRVASFPRRNGSGSPIVTDPATGNWLLAIGTWFHQNGFASGQELRLLQEFQRTGVRDLAGNLEGFFVIAVRDVREKTVHVVTDLVGSCHCFLRAVGGGLAISNSSLLLAALEESQLDPIACQEFLATGNIYEDRSLFRGVHKLAPASIYRFSGGALQASECYWQISGITPESLDGPRASRALWAALADAAEKIGRVFQRPVCDLTGGYDSRALVAAFLAARGPISTVVTGPADSPDVIISKGLAKLAQLPHLHLQKQMGMTLDRLRRVLPLTDGEYDLVEYSRVQDVHETLSAQFDISINGSFGELARGYWWELLFPHTGKRQPVPAHKVAASRYAIGAYDLALFSERNRIDLVTHLRGVIERAVQAVSDRPNTLQMDQIYLRLRMQRWQGRIASSTNRIWPCLSPFMFRSVLEVTLATQTRARLRSLLIRRMLGEFSPLWANYPRENGCPCLPVTWKNFYRFAPLIGHYGKKVLRRAARLTGVAYGAGSSSAGDSPRMQLWSQEDVRTLLEPGTMCLSALMEAEALGVFLRRSQSPQFAFEGQWDRLLTLECALRALEAGRKRSS